MLGPEYGGLRPWEMDGFTPDEERKVQQYRAALEQRARIAEEVN